MLDWSWFSNIFKFAWHRGWSNFNKTMGDINYSGGDIVLWVSCLDPEWNYGGITYFQPYGIAYAPQYQSSFCLFSWQDMI